jgi:hypothetical protein
MENKTTSLEDLFEKLKEYGDTRVKLFKLKSINKISGFFSVLISSLILFAILTLVIFCITIAFALLIGAWLGTSYWGFFIMGGIYIIIGLIVYSARNKFIKNPISNKLLTELLDD